MSQTEDVLMPAGRYKGMPADVSYRRSIRVDDWTDVTAPEANIVVDHFFHAGEYWRAVIPLHGLRDVHGQSFNWSKPRTRRTGDTDEVIVGEDGIPRRSNPLTNHLQARFVFDDGHAVQLFSDASMEDEPVHRLQDAVYSIEAVGPPGIPFNPRDAFFGNLLAVHRFMSVTENVLERLAVKRERGLQTPALAFSEDQKRLLLLKALQRADAAGDTQMYYLLCPFRTNNCTSNPFQIIDEVADYGLVRRLTTLLYRFPLNPNFYLRLRGLHPDPGKRYMLRNEFASFLDEPTTQKRKREFVRAQLKARKVARANQQA